MPEILYEDRQVIAVWKPAGMESQAARGFGADMVSELKRYIHSQSPEAGEPYVGVIHRLDKPVSGILVYARDKKSAAALSRQVSEGQMEKKYLAVVCGKVPQNGDKYVDYLLKDEKANYSHIVDKGTAGAKRAELAWRALGYAGSEEEGFLTLAEIELKTGRHHQIRVQMAGHGLPLWGDRKYGTAERENIALSAYRLSFRHPAAGKLLRLERFPDGEIFHRDWKKNVCG